MTRKMLKGQEQKNQKALDLLGTKTRKHIQQNNEV